MAFTLQVCCACGSLNVRNNRCLECGCARFEFIDDEGPTMSMALEAVEAEAKRLHTEAIRAAVRDFHEGDILDFLAWPASVTEEAEKIIADQADADEFTLLQLKDLP